MFKTFNRPVSSHITIYSPQISSLFSIWHRISGILLISSFFLSLYSLKFSVWWLSFRLYDFMASSFMVYLVFLVCVTSFSYHLLNGLRHILWDFNLFLTNNLIFVSSILIVVFLLIFQVIIFKIFIY